MSTHYAVLGVKPTATRDDIVRAYRALIWKHHPDRVGPSGIEMAVKLNNAYHDLSDEDRRQKYDRSLAPPEPPAAASPTWVQPDPTNSYAPQQSRETAMPTKRDWSLAFPAGTRERLVGLGISVLVTAAALMVASVAGAYLLALVSIAAGVIVLTPRPKPAAFIGLAAPSALGVFGIVFGFPVTPLAGFGLMFALVGWAGVYLAAMSFRTLVRRHREAREWTIIQGVIKGTGIPIQWVTDVSGPTVLLTDPITGEIRTVQAWVAVEPGSWVALNAVGLIVSSVAGTAFESLQWVEKDTIRRALLAVKRADGKLRRAEKAAARQTARA